MPRFHFSRSTRAPGANPTRLRHQSKHGLAASHGAGARSRGGGGETNGVTSFDDSGVHRATYYGPLDGDLEVRQRCRTCVVL